MFYTIFGIALFLYNLDIFSTMAENIIFKVVPKKIELGATFAIFLVWLLIMASIMQQVEGWEYYGDALYFSFVSSTTIGVDLYDPFLKL